MDDAIVHVEEAFGCAVHPPFVTLLWRGVPTPGVMERCYAAFDRAAERFDGPIAMLSVVEEPSPPPEPSQLPSIAKRFEERPRIVVACMVREGGDPWIVEVASSLFSLTRRAPATKLCTDLREALTWLVGRRLHTEPDEALRRAITAQVAALRAALPHAG